MVLPKKEVVTQLGAPQAGTKQWWSGGGDDYDATLTRQVTLPAGSASLTFQARWNIEDCGPDPCDYAFVEVNDGTGFKAIPGSITKAAEGNGIDGEQAAWTPATFDLSAFAGKTISLRFHYKTDGAAQGQNPNTPSGIFLDAIKLTAGTQTVFEDGAETGNNGWTPIGFTAVGATKSTLYDNYYIASNRTYTSYDRYLQSGPYNFASRPARQGRALPVPERAARLLLGHVVHRQQRERASRATARCSRSTRTRGRSRTWTARCGAAGSRPTTRRSGSRSPTRSRSPRRPAGRATSAARRRVPVFDDRKEFWDPALPNVGVKVPHAGVRSGCSSRTARRCGSASRPRRGQLTDAPPPRSGAAALAALTAASRECGSIVIDHPRAWNARKRSRSIGRLPA